MGKVGAFVFIPEAEANVGGGALCKTGVGLCGILGCDLLTAEYKDNYNLRLYRLFFFHRINPLYGSDERRFT